MNLFDRAKRKDSEAFEKLMRDELSEMYRVAYSMLRNDEDVADAIQDTMIKCWEKIDTLKKPSFFRTWLIRILINNCNNILRKRKITASLEDIPDIPISDSYCEGGWKDIIQCLDEKYSLVMELYYVDELQTSEIANILGISDDNVRKRLSRGRKQLEKIVKGTM
ncbi:MAG: sigma-70 family RNA polymerase sigma factor [Lachnospiraceae bacterium]|nr:sigma-70 family RNA polymerase sigma factor [Lachnospiraceae bacterium]